MEKWQCVRVCFFQSKLYQEGETVEGNEEDMPRHFVSLQDGRKGCLGAKEAEQRKQEPMIDLEAVMKGSPLLEKAKHLSQMNKHELISYGTTLGLNLNPEEFTRAEMIRECIEAKEKRGSTNQELANVTKR